jgi:hypothetical protein
MMTFATCSTRTRYGYSFLSNLPRWLIWEYAIHLELTYCYLCGHALLPDDWVLEHNHLTDEVRGLAHYACNTAVGHMETGRSLDDPVSEFRSTYYRVKGVNKLFHHPDSTEDDTAACSNWKALRDVLGDDNVRGFLTRRLIELHAEDVNTVNDMSRRILQQAVVSRLGMMCDQVGGAWAQ